MAENVVLADEAAPNLDGSMARACEYIMSLSLSERLQKTDIL